jgi:hypothetical protein
VPQIISGQISFKRRVIDAIVRPFGIQIVRRSLQSTERYTAQSAARFKNFFRD